MRFLFITAVIILPVCAAAFSVVKTDESQPYRTVPVEETLDETRYFLGELTGYPMVYEIDVDRPSTFTIQVRQIANKAHYPFHLTLVRQNDHGGAREVARMNVAPDNWTSARDSVIGLAFITSPIISEAVEPGLYQIEISSPENTGAYLLQIGTDSVEAGYLAQLSAVRTVQQHFGYGIITMLGSSLVFYPLVIVLLFWLFYKSWQYRYVFQNPTTNKSV